MVIKKQLQMEQNLIVKKNGRYYQQLKLMERQGLIKDIKLQVKFELQPKYKKNNKTIRAINYIADFTYYDLNKGKTIIADTKRIQNRSI